MRPNWSHFCFLVFLKIAKTGPFGPRNIQITKPAKILASVWIIVIQVSWSKLQVSSLHEIWWHPQLDLWPFLNFRIYKRAVIIFFLIISIIILKPNTLFIFYFFNCEKTYLRLLNGNYNILSFNLRFSFYFTF